MYVYFVVLFSLGFFIDIKFFEFIFFFDECKSDITNV